MNTTRLARLIALNVAVFLAYWIARAAVPWPFALPALGIVNICLAHRNQRLFRLYHGLQTCALIIWLAVTAGNHTLQELLAILLMTALFEVWLWLAGNLALAAESPAHFLRLSIIACCYAVLGNTDPLLPAIALVVLLGGTLLSAFSEDDPHLMRRLLPSMLILALVFSVAVMSPIMRAPTLPRAAVWLLPGTPVSTPKPAGQEGSLPVTLPNMTLRRVLQDFFWQLFGFMYLPLAVMSGLLLAAMLVSVYVLHNSWSQTIRTLLFPIALITSALLFAVLYTGIKTAQISSGISAAGQLTPLANYDDIVKTLRGQGDLPPENDALRTTLRTIVTTTYWIVASLLIVSIVTTLRDMVFEFRHEVLLSMLDRKERKKVLRTMRRLASLDEGALLEDPATSITALFALGVEAVASVGPRLHRGETADEFGRRTATEVPACGESMLRLSALFTRARYSRASVSGEDVLAGRSALQELQLVCRGVREELRRTNSRLRPTR
ncbi:MAG: DUF4129 domain-containing protein [Caldisericota bacterium]|nr:DUF4129 domain-containing protein [Caldisericota bacterium]